MIRIEGITKSYGSQKVLEEITMSFPPNKMTALIGSNGSGKSTLLSIISRTITNHGGKVWIDNIEVKDFNTKALAKKVSILKQTNSINVKLTVRELVSFGRYPHNPGKLLPIDLEQIEKAMIYMDILDIQDRYVDELSGGQRQRVYLAMVIAQDTEYILLDEPLNNLDMKHAVQMMRILKNLIKDLNKTIIIVLHEINFAAQYADYILALKNGKYAYFDQTENVINNNTLKDIFDLDFQIIEHDGKKICNYF